MPKRERLTCLAYHATPKNVKLALNLGPIITRDLPLRTVFLINAPRTVPDPAAVLEGVQYGNNGTEFMGSLAGATGYPIEDDVRLGITYGQFEGQYEGDLVLPAEADVKTGVGYGADGTEYTGELVGGGGGVSRSRVVNG